MTLQGTSTACRASPLILYHATIALDASKAACVSGHGTPIPVRVRPWGSNLIIAPRRAFDDREVVRCDRAADVRADAGAHDAAPEAARGRRWLDAGCLVV